MLDAATAQLNATLNIDPSVAWRPERGGRATFDNTLLYVKYVITRNSEWRIGLRFGQPRCAIARRNQGGRVGRRAQKVYLRTFGIERFDAARLQCGTCPELQRPYRCGARRADRHHSQRSRPARDPERRPLSRHPGAGAPAQRRGRPPQAHRRGISGALGRRRGARAGGEEAQGLIPRRAERRRAVSRTLWVTRFKAAFGVVSRFFKHVPEGGAKLFARRNRTVIGGCGRSCRPIRRRCSLLPSHFLSRRSRKRRQCLPQTPINARSAAIARASPATGRSGSASKARVTIEPALDGAGRDLPDEALAPASFLARAHRSGAELKTQLDLAFGARLQSEYLFRGVSLGRLGVEAYGEARFVDGLVYAGLSAHAAGLTDTVAGVNVAAGFRPRVGPLSFDLGVVRYHRPGGGERAFAFGPVAPAGRTDFFELGAGAAYAVDAALTVGARVAYAPDWFGSGRRASYASLRAHYRLPGALVDGLPPGFALSANSGRMTIGSAAAGARIPDYTAWNFGASYSFDRFTIDLRYHDSDLSRKGCGALAAEMGLGLLNSPSGRCAAALVATLSVEFAVSEPGLANP